MKIRAFVIGILILCLSINVKAQYKYLGTYTSDGLPNYLIQNDVVSASTLSLISSALPENYPVPVYNPQYISSGYDTDIKLVQDAEVWVTFVDEGAGYKNVLAFYTYDLNNPPTTMPSNSQITIIFPNVSKLGSGGSLTAGNKVKIGSFQANTGIGFMLIADGWRSGAVSNGIWRVFSNPSFNPEANASLRNHNVLISDVENQRIILGFEDIKRDLKNCDNDFNDALFYVTASPYTAIASDNIVPIQSNTLTTQSANLGGLESNGRLASKIAQRNFERDKNPNLKQDDQKSQSIADIEKNQLVVSSVKNLGSISTQSATILPLNTLFPNTGMFGNEVPYTSTPKDLLKITNAEDVFSLDYYNGDDRVSAALVTYTSTRVYDHSKSICDRLNGSSLENIRTITLGGHKLVNITFKKADGEIEYAVSFSVQTQGVQYRLYSYWNIDQYPKGAFLNFQIWGKNMGQVCAIVTQILSKLENQAAIVSDPAATLIPAVYVKNGFYKNGKLHLTIVNKIGAKNLVVSSNASASETQGLQTFQENVDWANEKEKSIILNNAPLFDAGISIGYLGSPINDALYLADGAWGVDYLADEASNINLSVAKQETSMVSNNINIERNPTVSGKIKGTFNLFRNAKAGNSSLDISELANLSFTLNCALPVEVVLVSKDLTDWNQRAIYHVAATKGEKNITIPLNQFTSGNNKVATLKEIKSIVFTIRGDYNTTIAFSINVANVNFNNNPIQVISNIITEKLTVYPNPAIVTATIVLPNNLTDGKISIIDLYGKIVQENAFQANSGNYTFNCQNMNSGLYIFKVVSNDQKVYTGKFLKN